KAISTFRASATMPTFRARLFPEPKRRWYHWLNSLSGCQRNQSQASSTRTLRTCLLPALLIPCSRSLLPLWYGVGVRPTNDPSSCALPYAPHGNNPTPQNPGPPPPPGLEPHQPPHWVQIRLLAFARAPLFFVGRVPPLPVQRLPDREFLQQPLLQLRR